MRIRTRYTDAAGFIGRYAGNIFRGGIFIETPRPHAVGTRVRFEFLLRNDIRLLRGEGSVVAVRERDAAGEPAGMGVRLVRLDRPGLDLVDGVLRRRRQLAPASEPPSDLPTWNLGAASRSLLEPDDDFHAELDAAFDVFMVEPEAGGAAGTRGHAFPGDDAPIELATGDIEILEVPGEADFGDLDLDLDPATSETPGGVKSRFPERPREGRSVSPTPLDESTRRHSIADAELLLTLLAAADQPDPAPQDPERTQKLDPETVAQLLSASSSPLAPRARSTGTKRAASALRERRRLLGRLRDLEVRVGAERLAAATTQVRALLEDYVALRSGGSPGSGDTIEPEVARSWLRKLGLS